jgi:hypothetical protein
VLGYVPGRFQVIRRERPNYACQAGEAITHAPASAMPTPARTPAVTSDAKIDRSGVSTARSGTPRSSVACLEFPPRGRAGTPAGLPLCGADVFEMSNETSRL